MIFGLDPGLLGGLALHWTCSAMAQSTIAFVTASVAGKTIKTNSFAQVSARVTDDDIVLFYNGTNHYNGFVSKDVADSIS